MVYSAKILFIMNYLLLSSVFAFGTNNPFITTTDQPGNTNPFQLNPQESNYSEANSFNGDSNIVDNIFTLFSSPQFHCAHASLSSPEILSAPMSPNISFEEFLLQQTQTVDSSSPAPAAGDKRSSSMIENSNPPAKKKKNSNSFTKDTTLLSSQPNYKNVNINKAVYWRIAPDQPGYFQLLDAKGSILHTAMVLSHKGERKLVKGFLKIVCGKKSRFLRRIFNDCAVLEEHGFAPGQIAKIFRQSEMHENHIKIPVNGTNKENTPGLLLSDLILSSSNTEQINANTDIEMLDTSLFDFDAEFYAEPNTIKTPDTSNVTTVCLQESDLDWLINQRNETPESYRPDIEMHDIQEADIKFLEAFA